MTAVGVAVATALGTSAFTTGTHVPQGAVGNSGPHYTDTVSGDTGSQTMTRKDDSYSGIHNLVTPHFSADGDVRNSPGGQAHPRTGIPDDAIMTQGAGEYYASHAHKLDSFQLMLRGPGYSVGPIGFFYADMPWETGDASDGSNGFGGWPGAVGFGNGNGNGNGDGNGDDEVPTDSILGGIVGVVDDNDIGLDQNPAPIKPNQAPVGVPEPTEWSLLLLGLLVMSGLVFARPRRTD